MGRNFENRKGAMMARWDRMAKQFTRIAKDIVIAVKAGGPEATANPLLRRALTNARAANMPNAKVEAAIKRAYGRDSEDYQVLLYEGFAPHGVAVLVEAATDNPTRTVANVRSYFTKAEGTMAAAGAVSFQFDHVGVFKVKAEDVDVDAVELDLIDHGLEDLTRATGKDEQPILVLRCAFHDFGKLQAAIEERGLEVISAEPEYRAQNMVELGDTETDDVVWLIDRLEQDDDVQNVFHNLA